VDEKFTARLHSGQAIVTGADDDGARDRFWTLNMPLTHGQKQERPRVNKPTKAHEKSH